MTGKQLDNLNQKLTYIAKKGTETDFGEVDLEEATFNLAALRLLCDVLIDREDTWLLRESLLERYGTQLKETLAELMGPAE